jgi:hypothetical protein
MFYDKMELDGRGEIEMNTTDNKNTMIITMPDGKTEERISAIACLSAGGWSLCNRACDEEMP